ncbi:MAG TPA: plastocyanin/azurin family copper-binding protein [Pyrinomonadaceae bacterium]|nr:plastocyanin/azurin family copper-binding protein [Pyrinomonadaceae bacterium]
MIGDILRDLRQPEYIHVLINPLPVYGLALGLIGLLVAICQRSRAATIAALVVVLISAAAAWPAYEYGERAFDSVLSMADKDGRAWLAAHRERAEDLIWFFYAVAILSAIALIVPIKWPRLSLWLAVAVLVLGAVSLGVGGYIAYAGGRIRHREFRNEPPPKALAESAPGAAASPVQPAGSVAPAAAQVTIRLLKYSPAIIQIRTGETVEWTNNDSFPHTVTSEGGGELNSGSIEDGGTWRHTFSQPGTFSYVCTFHDWMKGTVIVK